MIIKSIRVPCERVGRIASYLASQGENERVEWLAGAPENIQLMGEISKLAGKVFAVRHIVIAPHFPIKRRDLTRVLREYCAEYNVPAHLVRQVCVVEHHKANGRYEGANVHWHIAVPETDPRSLRTLESAYTKMRDEKLSRISELLLKHPVVPGRFNKEIFDNLSETRRDLDLRPFMKALKNACVGDGKPEEDWLAYRRMSPVNQSQFRRRGFSATNDDEQLDAGRAPSFC